MENCLTYVYLNGELIIKPEQLPNDIDITEKYMGISFGYKQYYSDPRFFGADTYIDNIEIYNRIILPEEVYSENSYGLIVYWTFENHDNNITLDEVNRTPLILFEPFELICEETGLRNQ
ncbi:MAG: hypothetical protein N2490_03670 [Ignavibacteria bacterium]|nr:hypothetical protein [Ignavibacteria bacterium]